MILQIIGLACLAHILVDFIQHWDKEYLNIKPLNCELCMGTWISIVPLTLQFGWEGFCASAIVGVLSDVIYRIKQRI